MGELGFEEEIGELELGNRSMNLLNMFELLVWYYDY
jgi:hypothetical protein